MKSSVTIAIFVLVTIFGASSFAQFDRAKSRDRKPKVKAAVKVEAPEVKSADIKRLKQAYEDKEEKELIKAAAVILGKDPKNLKALNTLAIFHFGKKRPGLAKIIISRALESHPEEAGLHSNLGVVLLSEGDLKAAVASFRKALSYKSRHRTAMANLGSIYLEFKDNKKAIGALEEGFDAISGDLRRGDTVAAEVANNYALALAGAGKSRKAKSIFEKIVDGGARNPYVYLNYAILLNDVLKDGDKALRILSKVRFMTDDRKVLKKADELEKRVEI